MKKISGIIIFILFIIALTYLNNNEIIVEKEETKLIKCIDGDTAKFLYNNEEIKVRFLAVNTPEIGENVEPYGEEASKYTCDRLNSAKKIELELDQESDKYDKYNRLLAWIFIDGELLQLDLVSQGYAEVKYIYGNYKYLNELKIAQETAKNQKIGIWKEK